MIGVYNVPMALDITLSHTEGLSPDSATSQNMQRVQQARQYTLGPIPATTFMDRFFPLAEGYDRTGLLSFRNAFSAVPQCAESASQIYEPLVRLVCCGAHVESCFLTVSRRRH